MSLPVEPPVSPMLAKSAARIPAADAVDGGLSYEPKWDGFRAIVFRDGDDVVIGSRNEKPLTRYFPEVVDAVLAHLPRRCVLDGEIVVTSSREGVDRLDFERLLERIHPADSRVRKLSVETPAIFVAFDLLALEDESLLTTPFAERRERLESVLTETGPSVRLTALTGEQAIAEQWFGRFEGAGLDGVVAKANRLPYLPGERAMIKVKHIRTADVVLGGYRLHKASTPERPLLGSMLLGLHDDTGHLHQVGVCASFKVAQRAALVDELAELVTGADGHPWAGEQAQPNRWNAGRDTSFVHLRPVRVLEVGYDHMEGTRFRHTTQFKRWRPDRDPESCRFDQLEEPVSYNLDDVWATT
jgi:ATP-dependent DNA ligase